MRPRDAAAVARRYARALLDVACTAGDPGAVRTELRTLVDLVSGNPELAAALAHPAVRTDKRRALVAAVGKAAGTSPLVLRLLDLLAERGRLAILPEVAEAYAEVWGERAGVVRAEVATAAPVESRLQEQLAGALGRAAGGRTVEIVPRTDPALLGGVLVRMAGRTYDGSVRGRLRALRARLAGRAEGGAA